VLTSPETFFICTVIALAIAGSVVIWRHAGWLPAPSVKTGFTLAAKTADILGGVGFLASAWFFIQRYLRQPATEDLVFASYTLLFSASVLYFGFSQMWDAEWWVWHGFSWWLTALF
jgi:hypothetical protein